MAARYSLAPFAQFLGTIEYIFPYLEGAGWEGGAKESNHKIDHQNHIVYGELLRVL